MTIFLDDHVDVRLQPEQLYTVPDSVQRCYADLFLINSREL